MHNPIIVVVLAVWFSLVHLGMLIGMASLKRTPSSEEKMAIVRRRGMAATVAYLVALAATIAFAVIQREKAKTHVTYWATMAIIFFGLSTAIYSVVPKIYRDNPTPEDQQRQVVAGRVSNIVHLVALIGALMALVLAPRLMK